MTAVRNHLLMSRRLESIRDLSFAQFDVFFQQCCASYGHYFLTVECVIVYHYMLYMYMLYYEAFADVNPRFVIGQLDVY